MDQSLPLRVVILRLAYEDVDVIFDWLKERSSVGANRWYVAFLESAASLANDPLRHGLAPEASAVTEPYGSVSSKHALGESIAFCSSSKKTKFEFSAFVALAKRTLNERVSIFRNADCA
jgi:hypothetical protein